MLNRERTIKMNLQKSDLASCRIEIINCLFNSLACRTHNYDNFFRILCAVVIEKLIVTTRYLAYFIHVSLYDIGYSVTLDICALFALEIDIRVYVVSSVCRMLRIKRFTSECLKCFLIYKRTKLFIIERLNTLHFVRCTETVEAMHERISCFYCRKMSYSRKIHCLLRRR